MDRDDVQALIASDPDPVALIDVLDLIAPEALITGWEPLVGGLGTAMHRIDVTMPSGATTDFVLRRYLPEVGDDGEVALREAMTLEALRNTPVSAPDMLWADPDGAVFGRPAMAMTTLPGTVDLAGIAGWVDQLADALVALQWVPADAVAHLPRMADLAALRNWILDGDLPDSPYVDSRRIAAALERGPDEVEAAVPTLVHGDFHPGNVLRSDSHISGVVDWAGAIVADPRYDVAYCALDLTLFASHDVAEQFVTAYEQLRGPLTGMWFFRLLAAATALPDPADWAVGYRGHGVEVDDDALRGRFTEWVEAALVAAHA